MIAVADRLAASLIIGRDRQRLTERADLFRHLHDFSEAVNGTLDPNELYRAIVRGIPRVVPADIAALVVLDRATGRYQLMAMDGTPDEQYVGVEVRPGEGMAGRAIRDRALVIDEQFGRPSFAASVATAGDPALDPMQAAAVPLVREGTVVGAVTVLRHDQAQRFSQLDRDALAMIAEQVALGVANAFLHADVRELAVRDPLTGLFNRRYLDPALDQLMAQRARVPEAERPALSVVMYDFDHFSDLNNKHGHQAGDAVLKAFGSMLLARRRSSDVVARFGGEEFAAVLYRATLDDAVRIAEQVREQVASQPVEGPNGEELHVTISAGCATAGPEAPTAEALLRAADVALYMAKRAGRNRVAFYAEEGRDALRRLSMATLLGKAVARDEFVLHYQPIVSLVDGGIDHVEALIRWCDPERGLVMPADFIPVAEETGLIESIGDWVLEEVCDQVLAWRAQGIEPSVSFNVSPRQLRRGDLVERVGERLGAAGVDAARLVMEVTETAAMQDAPERVERVLRELGEMGFRIAIDDFGSGYSTFSYLSSFPVDLVKIDREFTRAVLEPRGLRLVAAIVEVAHTLQMAAVAEGIELPAQQEALRLEGCDRGQGFWIARPLEPEDVAGWLEAHVADMALVRALAG
jgi:diguanylate cyclase (GGDEF)-like protein